MESEYKVLEQTLFNNHLMRYENTTIVQKTLTNEDFKYGTYIISQPGYYILGEDISFNPNKLSVIQSDGIPTTYNNNTVSGATVSANGSATAWTAGVSEPHSSQLSANGGPYNSSAFALGFFAAIVIASDDVTLDLNNYKIEQSEEHALLQRFYSNIELANTPFIPTQGPHDFGSLINSAKNVCILNGTIGRSVHHGIHGNNNKDILIKDIEFVNYEVAAIHLNQAKTTVVSCCKGLGHRTDIPVNGLFSHIRFLRPYLEVMNNDGTIQSLTLTIGNSSTSVSVADTYSNLVTLHNQVYANLVSGTAGWTNGNASYELFANYHGLPDGSAAYGFVLNGKGIAVNGFPEKLTTYSKDVYLHDCLIQNLVLKTEEFVGIRSNSSGAYSTVLTDPRGGVFNLFKKDSSGNLTVIDSNDRYVGTDVTNAQLLTYKAHLANSTLFSAASLSTRFLSINNATIDYVENGNTIAESNLSLVCNGDSMFHVNKGIIGYKVDNVINGVLRNCRCSIANNTGEYPSTRCGIYEYSHPNQNQSGIGLDSYTANNIRGFSVASSKHIELLNSDIVDSISKHGCIFGTDIIGESDDITICDHRISNLTAGSNITSLSVYDSYPMPTFITNGIMVRQSVGHNINLNRIVGNETNNTGLVFSMVNIEREIYQVNTTKK